jgi:hypothetical protein
VPILTNGTREEQGWKLVTVDSPAGRGQTHVDLEEQGMDEEKSAELKAARTELQKEQARWGKGLQEPTGDITQAALDMVTKREGALIEDGPYLREGVFKYEVQTERDRWAATRALIRRTAPGPYEDPNYLVLIAREAASVEWFIENTGGGEPAEEVINRIVIGTTGAPQSEGFTRPVGGSTAIIAISAGMIDLLYQTSKAVVLSWKENPAPEGTSVAFSGRRDDTIAVIDANPYPVELLRDTLATWFYEGFPRAKDSTTPPPQYHPPLSILIKGAERFIVAHEYGHAFMDVLGLLGPDGSRVLPPPPANGPERELRADLFATVAVAQSARRLDHLPPNMALQGAIVAMKAHQVFLRAVGIAMNGVPIPDQGSESHPPFDARLKQLQDWYVKNHPDPKAAQEDLGAMRVPAETVELLWERAQPQLLAQFIAGRQVAPIWRQ